MRQLCEGFVDGYFSRRRGNANNIDLNRDFPDQFFSLNNEINARQPETRAIMNWLREIQFAASASLHGCTLHVVIQSK